MSRHMEALAFIMPGKKYISKEELLADQMPELAELLKSASELVISSHPLLKEVIKWNSIAFQYTGEMKPFDPKLYLRDVVVFNIHRNYLLMVFPTGMRVMDEWNVLEGNYADGRRMISIKSFEDLVLRREAIQQIIKAWISGVE